MPEAALTPLDMKGNATGGGDIRVERNSAPNELQLKYLNFVNFENQLYDSANTLLRP